MAGRGFDMEEAEAYLAERFAQEVREEELSEYYEEEENRMLLQDYYRSIGGSSCQADYGDGYIDDSSCYKCRD